MPGELCLTNTKWTIFPGNSLRRLFCISDEEAHLNNFTVHDTRTRNSYTSTTLYFVISLFRDDMILHWLKWQLILQLFKRINTTLHNVKRKVLWKWQQFYIYLDFSFSLFFNTETATILHWKWSQRNECLPEDYHETDIGFAQSK